MPIVELTSNKGVHAGKVTGYYDDLSEITGRGKPIPASELPQKLRRFILQANALYDIYRARIGTKGSRKEVVKRAAILLEEYSYVEILEAIANYEGEISITGYPPKNIMTFFGRQKGCEGYLSADFIPPNPQEHTRKSPSPGVVPNMAQRQKSPSKSSSGSRVEIARKLTPEEREAANRKQEIACGLRKKER